MPNIIVSYRRADSDAIAGRIRDKLADHYGADAVFMDIDSIPFGIDFRDHVKEALLRNDLLIAIIGPKWLGPAKGRRARIHDEDDPVRLEIEAALHRGIPVVPVLVGRSTIPRPADLPESLRDLSFRNAAEVDAGRDFHQHMERLIRSIDRDIVQLPGRNQEADSAGAASSPDLQAKIGPGAPTLLSRAGLRFADARTERLFMARCRDELYVVGQTSMALGIAAWMAFGAADLLSETGGIVSTRFRYMVGTPILLLLFALSFTDRAKRNWQPFFALFGVVGVCLLQVALLLVKPESWFNTGHATMSYMLFMALVGLAPFTVAYAVGVGLFVGALHVYHTVVYGNVPAVVAFFHSLFVASAFVVMCCAAYFRETALRRAFRVDGNAPPLGKAGQAVRRRDNAGVPVN